MKCTAIKLSEKRFEYHRTTLERKERDGHIFTAEECHGYSFPFIRRRDVPKPAAKSVAITNIHLPESFQSFNTGASLDKWSQKRPRLKSAKSTGTINAEDDKDFCYDTLETELSLMLDLDEGFVDHSSSDSLNNMEYEVHSDIEQLILNTERRAGDEEEPKQKSRSRRRQNRDEKREKESENSKKKKSRRRTIRFSEPPSPQTEQVIRVDVTSTVTAEDCVNNNGSNKVKVIDENRKELKRNLNERGGVEGAGDGDDFIVRCRQLALRQKRR